MTTDFKHTATNYVFRSAEGRYVTVTFDRRGVAVPFAGRIHRFNFKGSPSKVLALHFLDRALKTSIFEPIKKANESDRSI